MVINAVEAAFRTEWPKLVATLVRDLGDLGLAEDVASEAFVVASERWHRDGIPRRPGAWLLTTARRKAIDRIRRDRRFDDRREELVRQAAIEAPPAAGRLLDDQLALVFGCCHPALAVDAQVALTLRYVGGLSTAQIARAFLVPEATMAKRLVRAKHKISAAGIPIEIPDADRIDDRLDAVCGVVYAVFTEGHASASGAGLLRGDLCDEALFLADTLVRLVPNDAGVTALRALCRLTDARRATRVDENGSPVLLRDQDRRRWDRTRIEGGLADLATAQALAAASGIGGSYLSAAMIAAVHSTAPTYDETNWSAIVSVYDSMIDRDPNPVLALNRAAAIAERDGPAPGLAEIDAIEPAEALDGYHYFHSARGDLLARLERWTEAADAFESAIERCENAAERAWLAGRLANVTERRDEAVSAGTEAVPEPGAG